MFEAISDVAVWSAQNSDNTFNQDTPLQVMNKELLNIFTDTNCLFTKIALRM